jgi:hypothetical protein
MGEKLYRFDASAIDELNKDRTVQPNGQTICLADGRPSCPDASAIHAARLVNIATASGTRFGCGNKGFTGHIVWARYELISRFRQRVMWHKRIKELGLSEYPERFAENEIDVAVLPLLVA